MLINENPQNDSLKTNLNESDSVINLNVILTIVRAKILALFRKNFLKPVQKMLLLFRAL